jgi:hypothetical protein
MNQESLNPIPKKSWWKSRTFWVNAITVVAFGVAKFTGYEVPEGTIAMVIAGLNILLRFDTVDPIG